jgi:predicted deacylase
MNIREEIRIGDTVIAAGERKNVSLPIADLYTNTSLSMPISVVHSRKPGPVLFVSAVVHGDELNGVEIIRRLLRLKAMRNVRGTLITVPIVNVYGYLNQSRYLPDRRDLNRSFPGSPRGSIAARMAHIFHEEIVSKSQFGIDLHTGALNRSNLPQIRGNLDDPTTLELARAFGAPVIINANIRDGSLRACAVDLGIPMLIYEAGEALRFDEISIKAGVRGVLNVMRKIGMLSARKGKEPISPVLARSTSWVRAPASGIVNNRVNLGGSVTKDQQIAIVCDPLGQLEEPVFAPFDGIVIGRNNLPLALEGDALFNIAAFRSVSRAEEQLEDFAETHAPESPQD